MKALIVALALLLMVPQVRAEELSASDKATTIIDLLHDGAPPHDYELYLLAWATKTDAPKAILSAPSDERFEKLSAWYLESMRKSHQAVLEGEEAKRVAAKEIAELQQLEQDFKAKAAELQKRISAIVNKRLKELRE